MTSRDPYSQEAEQGVLGAMLIKPELIDILSADLTESDFFFAYNREVFRAIQRMQSKGRMIDFLTVAEYIGAMDDGESPLGYCAELHKNTPSVANAKEYARIVLERSIDRALIQASETVYDIASSDSSTQDKISQAQAALLSINSESSGPETITAREALEQHVDELERRLALGDKIDGLSTGIDSLDAVLRGLKPEALIVIAGRPKMGKAQPLTSNVLLADGTYIGMGDIAVGDKLASVDGEPSIVVGVYPQGVRPIYAVTLADGRVIEADAEHLWQVRNAKWASDKAMTTLELIKALGYERNRNRMTLVPHAGRFGGCSDIGMSPWLVGYLLGDGYLNDTSIRFSASEPYIVERVQQESGIAPKHIAAYDYRIATARGKANPVLDAARRLGIMGSVAHTKKIPDCVMSASYEVRAGVLAGLLESDGWVQRGNCVMYSSASERLRDDVVDLVRSLGGSARKSTKVGRGYRAGGEYHPCRDSYQAAIRLKALGEIIRSPRLLAKMSAPCRTDQSAIVSVEYVRDDLAQCIKVSHPRELYITDGWSVTHNTTFAMNIADACAIHQSKQVLVFSLEMSNAQLTDKSLASVGGIPLNALKDGSVFDRYTLEVTAATAKIADSGLSIYARKSATINQIRAVSRRHKLKHGLDLVVVDHIGLVNVDDQRASPVQRISQITRELKLMAKELGVPVIALSQLNRELEKRPDKRPIPSDLRDSGSIEQDADMIMFVYRDEVYNVHTEYRGVAEIIIGVARDIEPCTVKVRYQGKYSKFSDLAADYEPPEFPAEPPQRSYFKKSLLDD